MSRRASSSITATADLLSAPRIPSLAFSQPPSTSTGSIGAASGTVSMWAHSRMLSGPLPGIRASRFPASEPTAGPLPSSLTSSPIARSSAVTQSAQARSRPDGLSMRHSAANVSCSRSRSAVGGAPHDADGARDARRWCSVARARDGSAAGAGHSACASAAPTNSRNSGAGRSGRDLNSGWYWEAT